MSSRTVAIGAVLLLTTFLYVPAASAGAKLPKEDAWIEIRGDGLVLVSNAGERQALRAARDLDRLRGAIGTLTKLPVRSALPTKVYLFKNEGSFRIYREAFRSSSDNIGGFFVSTGDAKFMAIDASADPTTRRMLNHEFLHSFLSDHLAAAPLWFAEGFAEFYSTFTATDDEIQLGRPVQDHVFWLRERSIMPLPQLFAVTTESPEYNESSKAGVFYAESWALVHYLMVGNPEREKQIARFLTALLAGTPQEEAFRQAFATDYAGMEKELRAHIRQDRFRYVSSALPASAGSWEAPRPLSRAGQLFELGDLLLHLGEAGGGAADQFRGAADHFREAVRLEPKHAEALAGLGRLEALAGRPLEAEAYFARAVEVDPGAYTPAQLYAEHLFEQSRKGATPKPGELEKARQLFERSLAARPGDWRALAGYGSTFVADSGDPARGIESLKTALRIAPGRVEVAYNLMVLHLRAGQRQEAEALFRGPIARSADPELLRQGREAMTRGELVRLKALIGANEYDEALALMDRVGAATTDAELRARLAAQAAELRAHMRATRNIDLYNDAVEKARSGKYAAAAKLVDELIAAAPEPELLKAATELRKKLTQSLRQ